MRVIVIAALCLGALVSPVAEVLADRLSAPGSSAIATMQRAAPAGTAQVDRFVLLSNWRKDLWTVKRGVIVEKEPPRLRRQLNDLAGRGYRIVFASSRDLVLERGPGSAGGDVTYLIPPPQPLSALEAQVNAEVSHGGRLLLPPDAVLIESRSSGGDGAALPTSGLAAEVKRYQYQAVSTRRRGRDLSDQEFEEQVTKAVNDGFRVVHMLAERYENENARMVLLEKVTGDRSGTTGPVRPLELKWDKRLTATALNELARQGYRLRVIGEQEGQATRELLFDRSPDEKEAPEYAVVEFWSSTPEQALNEAASRGFRLIRHPEFIDSCCKRPVSGAIRLAMEKVSGAGSFAYRVADVAALNAEPSHVGKDEAVVGVIRLYRGFFVREIGTLIVLERPVK